MYESDDVSVIDPGYIVRKRLGDALGESETREQEIENMAAFGAEIDNNVMSSIRSDFEKKINEVRSNMNGGNEFGPPTVDGPMEGFHQQGGEDDLSEEEAEERMKNYMRAGSLKTAYIAYPVFKSVVMN